MSLNTKIEWADSTFNPWIGCTRISPACDHCYAAVSTPARTRSIEWGPGKPRIRTSAANWREPAKWDGLHAAFYATHGRRRRVFCASLADVFDNEVDPQWRRDLWDLIELTPNLDWMILTKRIGNALAMARTLDWFAGQRNVWLGATIANQEEAERDIPKLLRTPARVRFLSIEPMLGPIDLSYWLCANALNEIDGGARIDWVICGGESGTKARPMHPDWARSLRDQCAGAGVPFLFKQWGEHSPAYDRDRDRDDPDFRRCSEMNRKPGRWINLYGGYGFHGERVHYAERVGKKAAGRDLDGRTWDEVPSCAI